MQETVAALQELNTKAGPFVSLGLIILASTGVTRTKKQVLHFLPQ